MSRILTTYKNPPIADQLRTAATIEDLAILRARLVAAILRGQVDATDKTRESWERALWERVLALILSAEEDPNPTYVFNFVLRWPKTRVLEAALEAAMIARCRELPSPAERLRLAGVTIQGVTT